MKRSIKASGEDAEIRKNYKSQIEKVKAKKERKHADTQAEGSSQHKRQSSVGRVDLHKKANTTVQENTEENIELH